MWTEELYIVNPLSADAGSLQFPAGRYYGFSVGPESDWAECTIDVPGLGRRRIGPRLIYPTPPLQGQPRVTLNRYGPPKSACDSVLHVIGYLCPDAMVAGAAKRAPYVVRHQLVDVLQDGAATLYIPFAGRRHCRIGLTAYDDSTIAAQYHAVDGINWSSSSSLAVYTKQHALVSATVNGAEAVGIHIGGTNEEEAFDAILLTLSDDDSAGDQSYGVDVEVFGELGD
jgi:hypothetical protein